LEGGETRVGRAARGGPPLTTYYSVKRLIGRTADDPVVAEEAARLAYEVRDAAAVVFGI
jgi:molecular chaperone DnaK